MKTAKTPAIVTKESMMQLLTSKDQGFVIGRALVALFAYQTENEKADNATEVWNKVGFSGADGRSGTLTAKFWLKHRTLEEWQINRWMKKQRDGFPRICKYVKQLNEIALKRAQVL